MADQTNPRYEMLLSIIDGIREDAPREFASLYRPSQKYPEKINQAKDRAYCHLYLIVEFGLTDFRVRERLITDDSQDGGLDAYYIDHDNRKIYLIQSKFHITGRKFESHSITAEDLVKMEIDRILKGEKTDSQGKKYNDKVRRFQAEIRKTTNDIYDPVVVLLANVRHNDVRIKKLLGNLSYEAFDYLRTYQDLIFPLCAGTYNIPAKIDLEVYLSNKEQVRLKQEIRTQSGRCGITILFAPTKEIGRVTAKYKNAILQYNPRNYLSLAGNKVNRGIAESITHLTTSEFAVLNNGITILADDVQFSDLLGSRSTGRLTLTNPQIINGGQTAYTLSKIYEDELEADPHIFDGKEVMLKVISLGKNKGDRALFIQDISNATNRQSRVTEADRRSNNKVFVELQSKIYSHFGYLFERKEGEFYNGLDQGFLPKRYVIDRVDFLKAYIAYCGDPASCRSKGEPTLFRTDSVKKVFPNSNAYIEAFFSHRVYAYIASIEKLERRNRYGVSKYGNALRYGRFAMIAAVGAGITIRLTGKEDFDGLAKSRVNAVLAKWKDFEKYAKARRTNMDYFSDEGDDFDNYYKGRTMNEDIQRYFG